MNTTKSRTVLKLLVTGILILVILVAAGSSCNRKTTTSSTSTTKTSTTTSTTKTTTTSTTKTTTTTGTTTTTPTTTGTTTTTTTTTPTTTTTTIKPSGLPPTSQDTRFELEARDGDFSVHTPIVSAGARVTINFHNEDSGVAHNVVITTQDATKTIFQGSAITGPAVTTYQFTAPTTRGIYLFRSDSNPETMTGSLIVQ